MEEPPPSYEEAIASPVPAAQTQRPPPPRPPSRPAPHTPSVPAPGAHSATHSPANPGSSSSPDIYTNNPNLPFRYPAGHYCRKCRNTGFRGDKYCHTCWYDYYLKNHAYNPNPRLPFKYPRGFYCAKCNNTGAKTKNGNTCRDCFDRFAPRNNVVQNPYRPFYQAPFQPLLQPFQPYQQHQPAPPPLRVLPGDPRIGGVLCGSCRGTGRTSFLLFDDLCDVCGGVGRILR